MRGQIAIGSGVKIQRSAEIKDNAQVRRTLDQVSVAIKEGRLDDVFSLKTYDVVDLGREDGVKHAHNRIMTIPEIDKKIEQLREEKINDVKFAHQQIGIFSNYLRKNVHASNHGYSASMILNFVKNTDLRELVDTILDMKETIDNDPEWYEGKWNSMEGGFRHPETIRDAITCRIKNQHSDKLEDQI